MNSEDTIIMQPKNNVEKAAESNNVKEQEQTPKTNAPKDEKSSNNHTAGKVAATAAAGVFGGAAGGAASIAAANLMDTPEDEPVVEPVEEEVVVSAKPEPKPAPEPAPSEEEPKEEESKDDEPTDGSDDSVEQGGQEGEDYTGQDHQDHQVPPTGQEPGPTPTSDDPSEPEIQVLGVYERYDENGVHQEMAILTDGEKIAAVADLDGTGDADILAVDENMNGHFEEGEIHSISEIADHPVKMSQFEEAYIAQQEAQQFEEQQACACETSDESDFNNDVDFSMA